ncbi:MAG: alanine racemase, partial [Myxococcota bacterium]
AVVKADGYGHGVVPVARELEEAGARGFGVALAEEAIELRDAGVRGEILILNGVVGGAHAEVLHRDLIPVVYDLGEVEAFARAAQGRPFRVHLKVDTGMARLGVSMKELASFLDALGTIKGATIDGLMTHLACADSDRAYTAMQLARFESVIATVRAHGHVPRTLHAANSAATFRHPEARYHMVRPGISLFGDAGFARGPSLRSCLRLRTEVVCLRKVETGDRVGYDGAYVAPGPRTLAIVPLGYGDGLLRAVAQGGEVLVGGRRCPIVGRISMDLTHIDVSDLPRCEVGDEVVLLGAQDGPFGEGEITARQLAAMAGTVPYEVLTNISRRVPRCYA